MRVFPQLATGAVGHFPIRKRRISRTVVNESPGGHLVKLPDNAAERIEWELGYTAIDDDERDALFALFEEVEGSLTAFTFLDPAGNLFDWSEKLNEPVWERNALLQVTPDVADPLGTLRATRLTNTGAAALRIEQVINAPGWFHYACSVFLKSASPTQVGLSRTAGASTESATHSVTAAWKRAVLSGKFVTLEESVKFAIEIQPGQSVDIFGLQAEAQPGASLYKRTLSRSGVYPQARFAADQLSIRTDALNRHSCTVRVETRT